MSLRALAFTTSALFALVAAAASLRHVEGVVLQGDGADAAIAIETDHPANFTSFKLTRPTRIVVDFPETAAESRKQDAPAGGLVTRWSVEALGDESSPTARLVVEVQGDADYTLSAEGRTVALKLRPATGRPLVALAADAPVAEAAIARPPEEKHPAPPEKQAVSEAAAEEERLAKLAAEKVAREAMAQAAREAQERAEQERLAKVAADKAAREAKERAEQERLAKVAADKAAREAKAQAAREAQDRAEKARLAKVAADKAAREAKAQAAREAQERAEKARLAKVAADKAAREAKALEAKERAEKARLAKVAAEKAAREAKAQAEKERLARIAAARTAKAARPTPAPIAKAALTGIGFQRTAGGARVTVRTSHPVAFSVREGTSDRCVIDLESTQILVANNRRPLDARFFGTAVARVVPREDRAGGRVSIEVELAGEARCEAHANGGAVVVEVSGEGSALHAAAPAEGSP